MLKKIFGKKPVKEVVPKKRSINYKIDKDIVWYCSNITAHLMIRGGDVPSEELEEVTCIRLPKHTGKTARCPMCGDVEAHLRKVQSVTTFYMSICRRNGEKIFVTSDKVKANMALCPICKMWENVISHKKYLSDMEVRS